MKKIIKVISALFLTFSLLFAVSACINIDENRLIKVSIPSGEGFTFVGAEEVKCGNEYSFQVIISEGYVKGANFEVKVNEETVKLYDDGTGIITAGNTDFSITVSGIEKLGLPVHMSAEDGIVVQGESTVAYGENYTFNVSFAEGYEADNLKVLVNNQECMVDAEGQVTIENVSEQLYVYAMGAKLKVYDMTVSACEGVEISGPSKVTHGEKAEFAVELKTGYEPGVNFAVKVNGETVALNAEAKLIIAEVKGALSITVEGAELLGYKVTLSACGGVTLTGNDNVLHGDNYEFTVAIAEGYEKTSGYAVKVNGENVTIGLDGKVLIENVTGAMTVTVEGVQRISFAITLPSETEAYKVSGAESVYYGENYEFTLTIKEGYKFGAGFAVKVNGEAVELDANGKVVISNVKEAISVVVVGVERIALNVTFAGEHVLNVESSVLYFDDYSFMIELESGYEKGADFKVLVNGVEVTANAEGRYVIEDVKENIAITVSGVALKKSAILEENEFENTDAWWL